VTKELDLCIKSYSIAVNLNPKLSYVRTRLGMALQLSGEFHLACEQYEQAIAMGGEPPEAHTKLAECLMSHGLIFEAMSEYRKAIQLSDHKDPEPMVALAEILMRMERFNDALLLFRKAFEIGERSPRVLALLSWLYECMKRDEESLKYYTLLTDGDMNDPVVLLAIAKRCAESNLKGIKDPVKAIGLTRQLMDDMAFKHPAVLEVMASAYASLGDFKKAAEIQRQALAVLPELNPLFTSLKDRLYEFRDKID
jgi:tetratricopeptide (TPR) repeat protein